MLTDRRQIIPPDFSNIPDELKTGKYSALWRAELRPDRNEYTKTPRQINGHNASTKDPATWNTFEQVKTAYGGGLLLSADDPLRFDGIGCMLRAGGVMCLDLDGCLRDDGTLEDWAMPLVTAFDTYTEKSISGNGLHIFCLSNDPLSKLIPGETRGGRKKDFTTGGCRQGIELFAFNRFVTLTGVPYGELKPIRDCTKQLSSLCERYFIKRDPVVTPLPAQAQEAPGQCAKIKAMSNEELWQFAFTMKDGEKIRAAFEGDISLWGNNHSSADEYLCDRLVWLCGGDYERVDAMFRESGLMRPVKWDEKGHGANDESYGEWTINKLIVKAIAKNDFYDPNFKESKGQMSSTVNATLPTVQNVKDLMSTEFPPVRWAVEGILPAGCSVLAGAPKVGKSFFALHVALAVATGNKALSAIDVEPGDVLYLALEDTPRRLQSRINDELGGEFDSGLERFFYLTSCPRQDEGGADVIRGWLAEHKDARLVIVDTLQKFRRRKRSGEDAYQADYDAMADIKALADVFGTPFLVIHHTRKAKDEGGDWLQDVSGTQGISGAADSTLILKRSRLSDTLTLSMTGRDIEEKEVAVTRNEFGSWILRGDAEEFALSQTARRILDYLKVQGEGSPRDISNSLGLKYSTVTTALNRLWRTRGVAIPRRGRYTLSGGAKDDTRDVL